MNTVTFWCLVVACLAAAIAAAFGALAITLARRVDDLAQDLAGVTVTRPACPDRPRIAALENYARGDPGPARGRHSAAARRDPPPGPRGRWGQQPPDQASLLLGAPPQLLRRRPPPGTRR